MDGCPVKGDSLPIRVFLGSEAFWPFLQFPGSLLKTTYYLRVRIESDGGKVYHKRLPLVFGRYARDGNEAHE
jgi:hypothetical protein